ncbi:MULTISPECIES: polymorphic toxin type 17 domain-containing protein [Enterobacter]|uniref:polymorphic toxin type 17 domain-containing protein n=1 Tax=Enterobacter TaxID=547 RepID=UPI0032B77B6A
MNDPDPAVREAAQKKVAELTELNISRDQKVIDACGNGKADSAGCATERAKAYAAKAGYETGPYNSKFSQQYPDAYGQLVGLLNSTTPDAQNQQKVTEGLANYFMTATGVDYDTALSYAKTKQGADIILASVALGANLQAVNSYLVSKGAVTTANAAKSTSTVTKLSYVEEPPFNPSGTAGAAQPWSTKGRIKYVELRTQGKIRFVPDSNYSPSNPLPRGPNNGYLDKFGNEWVKGPSRTAGQAFEWDVQLSPKGKAQLGWATRDGSHLNVSLDGRITHK